ncbi:cytochrome P450 [Novosphingobium album (ex Hu et al. 2023)]|uniref:Cytochrome P450 n=1 Tax=Novosphingobium album (ex Hu et al. 2023) TaxID=2930093 RepID=A0ABT0B7F3_9SPHN|nr:cytochrome P450 [Novosphingobium album (ex Hu et al. 2023)]MCJ2180749.1 cytochrome P450 [Novosphingobium album (ex Hu et al. 2023)]
MATADSTITTSAPQTDIDLWSDEVLTDPYPYYRELRDLGPVVWMRKHGLWVVPRFSSIREALLHAEIFSSSGGVAVNDLANQAAEGVMLISDDPKHKRLRRTFMKPLQPHALKQLSERLNSLAKQQVDAVLAKGEFDAVTELAYFLPLTVVTELVGFSEEGKKNMLRWAAAVFDGMGPIGYRRTMDGLAITQEALKYVLEVKREDLDPDGWGAQLFTAADNGDLSYAEAQIMLMDYLGPALDTTINGFSSLLYLLGRNPDQWDMLRETPERLPYAIDEAVRLESPIRGFARVVMRDCELEGVAMRKGDRALMLYASANRDERRYPDPERFDIQRDARDHVAFGFGTHLCAGRNLAKLEITTMFNHLLSRIRRFEILEEDRIPHNTLRGLSKLMIRVHQ